MCANKTLWGSFVAMRPERGRNVTPRCQNQRDHPTGNRFSSGSQILVWYIGHSHLPPQPNPTPGATARPLPIPPRVTTTSTRRALNSQNNPSEPPHPHEPLVSERPAPMASSSRTRPRSAAAPARRDNSRPVPISPGACRQQIAAGQAQTGSPRIPEPLSKLLAFTTKPCPHAAQKAKRTRAAHTKLPPSQARTTPKACSTQKPGLSNSAEAKLSLLPSL